MSRAERSGVPLQARTNSGDSKCQFRHFPLIIQLIYWVCLGLSLAHICCYSCTSWFQTHLWSVWSREECWIFTSVCFIFPVQRWNILLIKLTEVFLNCTTTISFHWILRSLPACLFASLPTWLPADSAPPNHRQYGSPSIFRGAFISQHALCRVLSVVCSHAVRLNCK